MEDEPKCTPIAAEIRRVPYGGIVGAYCGYVVYLGASPPIEFTDIDSALEYIKQGLK